MFQESSASHPLVALAISFGLLAHAGSCDTRDAATRGDAQARSTPAPTRPELARPAPAPRATDWRARVQAELDLHCTADPGLCDELRGLQPRVTRAGSLRLTTPLLHDPRACAVLIDRLATGDEPAEVRAALVEALPRTGGRYDDAAAALTKTDPDPSVRVALVETMRWAGAEEALVGLRHGFADSDPEVRATAARVSGRREDGARLQRELLAALADPIVTIRAWAARSLGVLGIEEAKPALIDALDHESADLRLHALRAIHRIDPELAPTLPRLAGLTSDVDPRVARLAAELGASGR